MTLVITVVPSECVIMPDSTTGPLHAATPTNCPVERVVVNLPCSRAALLAAFCSVSTWASIKEGIMTRHKATTIHYIDGSARPIAANGIVFDEPKFLGAVVRKICPRTVPIAPSAPGVMPDQMR